MRAAPRRPAALPAALLAAGLLAVFPAASPATPRAAGAVVAPLELERATTIAPGAVYERAVVATDHGRQRVHVVAAEPRPGVLAIEAALSNDRVAGLERTSRLAVRRSAEGRRVVAALNGDVWSASGPILGYAPNGLHVEGGELVTADGVARAAFGIAADGTPRIGWLRIGVTLRTASGATFPIGRVNRTPNATIALYTTRVGPRLPTTLTGAEVVVTGLALPLTTSGEWTGTVAAVRPAGSGAAVAPGSVVLAVPASSLARFDLVPGAPVAITAIVTPGWEGIRHAVSGRGFLVRDGLPWVTPRPADGRWTHPRSAVGLTADGRLLLVAVDGRLDDSRGVDLDELAAILLQRGAVVALNLDGGGSTTLAVRRPGSRDAAVVSSPAGGTEVAVTNGIHLVLTVPTGPLAQLPIDPPGARLYRGETAAFSATPLDDAWNPVPLGPGEPTWSVDPALGTIDAAGRLTATGAGTGAVTATARGVTSSVAIEVAEDLAAPLAAAPVAIPTPSGAIARSVPVTVKWPAALEDGSGVARYELERSVDGGPFERVALPAPSATSVRVGLPRARTYAFRLRAVDRVGNVGEWTAGIPFRLAVAQETTRALVLDPAWGSARAAAYDRGAAVTTGATGAVATLTFTGSGVGWLAVRGPGRGRALVSIDGGPATLVDLRAPTGSARRIVFARSWTTVGEHTLRIEAVGTAGRPRVEIDGFVVLAPAP